MTMPYAVVMLALLAPAPPSAMKPPPPPAVVVGSYTMLWRGTFCTTHFHVGGVYACHWKGVWWHGTWMCKDGKLHVEEFPVTDQHSVYKWTVKIEKCGRRGELTGGSLWTLTPCKPHGREY